MIAGSVFVNPSGGRSQVGFRQLMKSNLQVFDVLHMRATAWLQLHNRLGVEPQHWRSYQQRTFREIVSATPLHEPGRKVRIGEGKTVMSRDEV